MCDFRNFFEVLSLRVRFSWSLSAVRIFGRQMALLPRPQLRRSAARLSSHQGGGQRWTEVCGQIHLSCFVLFLTGGEGGDSLNRTACLSETLRSSNICPEPRSYRGGGSGWSFLRLVSFICHFQPLSCSPPHQHHQLPSSFVIFDFFTN